MPVGFLIAKLSNFTRLAEDDRRALHVLANHNVRLLRAREDLIQQGDGATHVHLVLEGFGCRYKLLPDGRRQILAFFLPGDFCDIDFSVLRRMDHSIGALSTTRVAQIPADEIAAVTGRFERLKQALRWNGLVDEAILREWTVNLGQRSGAERVAHLFCEIFVRLRSIGLVEDSRCPFPISQTEMSDALGISVVHTNRMIQDLRAEGLVVLRSKTLQIPDLSALQRLAGFDPAYLHLDHEGKRFDAVEPAAVRAPSEGNVA